MNATDIPRRVSLDRLPKSAPLTFRLVPDEKTLAAMVGELDLLDLRKLRFEGRLIPEGGGDWRLEAEIGATAVQPCSVTLAPVTTRIDRRITRRYVADYSPPAEVEAQMPEDDSIEPLPGILDLVEVLHEALALALPDFPRAEGVELGEAVYAEPGTTPLTDEDNKPFAGLAALKKSLDG